MTGKKKGIAKYFYDCCLNIKSVFVAKRFAKRFQMLNQTLT